MRPEFVRQASNDSLHQVQATPHHSRRRDSPSADGYRVAYMRDGHSSPKELPPVPQPQIGEIKRQWQEPPSYERRTTAEDGESEQANNRSSRSRSVTRLENETTSSRSNSRQRRQSLTENLASNLMNMLLPLRRKSSPAPSENSAPIPQMPTQTLQPPSPAPSQRQELTRIVPPVPPVPSWAITYSHQNTPPLSPSSNASWSSCSSVDVVTPCHLEKAFVVAGTSSRESQAEGMRVRGTRSGNLKRPRTAPSVSTTSRESLVFPQAPPVRRSRRPSTAPDSPRFDSLAVPRPQRSFLIPSKPVISSPLSSPVSAEFPLSPARPSPSPLHYESSTDDGPFLRTAISRPSLRRVPSFASLHSASPSVSSFSKSLDRVVECKTPELDQEKEMERKLDEARIEGGDLPLGARNFDLLDEVDDDAFPPPFPPDAGFDVAKTEASAVTISEAFSATDEELPDGEKEKEHAKTAAALATASAPKPTSILVPESRSQIQVTAMSSPAPSFKSSKGSKSSKPTYRSSPRVAFSDSDNNSILSFPTVSSNGSSDVKPIVQPAPFTAAQLHSQIMREATLRASSVAPLAAKVPEVAGATNHGGEYLWAQPVSVPALDRNGPDCKRKVRNSLLIGGEPTQSPHGHGRRPSKSGGWVPYKPDSGVVKKAASAPNLAGDAREIQGESAQNQAQPHFVRRESNNTLSGDQNGTTADFPDPHMDAGLLMARKAKKSKGWAFWKK